jgi:hypothetical protein
MFDTFKKGVAMLTFECMTYYFSLAPRHLKFHYDQTNYKWVDVDSIMSNVITECGLIRKIYTLDHVDAKSLDEFVEKS